MRPPPREEGRIITYVNVIDHCGAINEEQNAETLSLGLDNCCLIVYYRQDAAKRQTAGIKFTTGQKSGFSPRRGDSLHRFTSNLAEPTDTWVRLAVQNFTSIALGGWEYQKFPLFGKESPRRGDSLDRFPKFLGAFIRLTILR